MTALSEADLQLVMMLASLRAQAASRLRVDDARSAALLSVIEAAAKLAAAEDIEDVRDAHFLIRAAVTTTRMALMELSGKERP